MNLLFDEVHGFNDFMVYIANNTLKDSIYGTAYRVSVGAILSTIDAATDIYVITTYYESNALVGQANAMIAMISTNLAVQLLIVWLQSRKKNLTTKLKEALITLLFLRPTVDAYRVSTNRVDDDSSVETLIEMMMNKVS